jgi:hypothetical protein
MPRFIRAGCEADGMRHEREPSDQKLLHSNPRRAPWLVRECDPPWIARSGVTLHRFTPKRLTPAELAQALNWTRPNCSSISGRSLLLRNSSRGESRWMEQDEIGS